MAEDQSNSEATTEEDSKPGRFDILGRLSALTGFSRRNVIIGIGFSGLSFVTIIAWLALAEVVAEPTVPPIKLALKALDDGEDELALALVTEIQEDGELPTGEYGGPLFILGALKVREAERHFSDDRRRSDYFIASRYLDEARIIGLPEGRQVEGLLLLGKSLLESRQLRTGIMVLQDAMESGARGDARLHYQLAGAYFYSPKPRYKACLKQTEAALADESITPMLKDQVNLLRARALLANGMSDESIQTIGQVSDSQSPSLRKIVLGQAWLQKFLSLKDDPAAAVQATEAANQAINHFVEARNLDKLTTPVTLDSEYLEGLTRQKLGEIEAAQKLYTELRRDHGSSPAGIAASLAEGDLYLSLKDYDQSINAYRRVLQAIGDPSLYKSNVLPLSEMKRRIGIAHQEFLNARRFTNASRLVDFLSPLFSRKDQIEFRAKTLRMWGEDLLELAQQETLNKLSLLRQARLRLREAGMAYETLAELRFASPNFIEDLWTAADVYRKGQSYSSMARILERYLRHEPLQRNALALTKLGDAYLSLNKPDKAIEAFEECLEFHPTDAASYRARIACAKSYRMIGDNTRAEELLLDNLLRSAMTPASPEWRDSLFDLGRLQIESERYDEAILTFDQAIRRYPDAKQTRNAQYLMGEAHRLAAAEPIERYENAQTVNEREKYQELARDHLESALGHYESVQREITLLDNPDAPERLMLRNCYMLRGTVLFQLERYEEAIKSFSSVSTIYQNQPFVLETLVQISHCWRRLQDPIRARGAIEQAGLLLARLPQDADFATSTNLSRKEWAELLNDLHQF